MLFHRQPWAELAGARIAVSTESATSVALLRLLLEADGIVAELVPPPPTSTRCSRRTTPPC
jgi:chorismate dehydratase